MPERALTPRARPTLGRDARGAHLQRVHDEHSATPTVLWWPRAASARGWGTRSERGAVLGCKRSRVPMTLTLKEQEHGHASKSMHLACVYSVCAPLSLSPRRSPSWLSSPHASSLSRCARWCSLGLRTSCSAPRVVRPSTRTKPLLCRRFFSFVGVSGTVSSPLGARRGRPLHSRLLRARGGRAARCAPVATCRHSEGGCLSVLACT